MPRRAPSTSTSHPGIRLPEGHRAVVIGGGGAIGRAIVTALATAGAHIVVLDSNGEAACSAIAGLDGRNEHATADVTDPAGLVVVAERIGPVDSVIYAAGVNYDGTVADTDWSAYRKVMSVNLDGAFHAAAAFVRPMIKSGRRGGSFVFLSSAAGLRGEAGASVYCASKFAMIGLVESFAAEIAPNGLRANAVCPGNVDTPMLKAVAAGIATRTGSAADEVYAGMARSGAAQRLIEAREVADLCLYLASPLSSAVTGAALRIDAGAMLSS